VEAPHLETLWQNLKNQYPDNIHIVSATNSDANIGGLNDSLWRKKFFPNLTFFLADNQQLGYTYPQFSDSYIPRSAVIGSGYKIKYNASGSPPLESDMLIWINELIEADINEPEQLLTENAVLYKNYPNPFNFLTTISFELKSAGIVRLSVYNAKGEFIRTVVDQYRPAGISRVDFDASALNSGLYYYKLEVGGISRINKMIYLK